MGYYAPQQVTGMISVGPTAPVAPATGDRWFDTAANEQKIWNGSTWFIIEKETHGAEHAVGGPDPIPDGAVVAALPKGWVYGLELSWVDAARVSIAPGSCRSDDDATDMALDTALTIDLTASGANGLDTGVEAVSTWYYVWLISGTAGVAGLFSASHTTPVLPAGYTYKRLLGEWRNNSAGDLLRGWWLGRGSYREFQYDDIHPWNQVLAAGAAVGWVTVSAAACIPPTSRRGLFVVKSYAVGDEAWGFIKLRRPGSTAEYGRFSEMHGPWNIAEGRTDYGVSLLPCDVDENGNFEYARTSQAGTTRGDIWVLGFYREL